MNTIIKPPDHVHISITNNHLRKREKRYIRRLNRCMLPKLIRNRKCRYLIRQKPWHLYLFSLHLAQLDLLRNHSWRRRSRCAFHVSIPRSNNFHLLVYSDLKLTAIVSQVVRQLIQISCRKTFLLRYYLVELRNYLVGLMKLVAFVLGSKVIRNDLFVLTDKSV